GAAEDTRCGSECARGDSIGGDGAVAPKVEGAAYRAVDTQPERARGCVWDTSDPEDCIPLQPFSTEDPLVQQARAESLQEWALRLGWKDDDMIQQVDSGSTCSRETVIFGHHQGLRECIGPAKALVEADTKEGWLSEGRMQRWTVPVRAVPHNVVRQKEWKLVKDELVQATKWGVTTDNSMAIDEDDVSRNADIAHEDLGNIFEMSTFQCYATWLGRAVAIVKAASARLGMAFSAEAVGRVAL
ncbi:MAG: hypothetical protein SGPRY_010804, partial [Prymnesium sp.]